MSTPEIRSNARLSLNAKRAARSLRVCAKDDASKIGKLAPRLAQSTTLTLVALLWSGIFCAAIGCSFHQKSKLPVVLKENPSAAELLAVVNQNGEKIQSFYSSNASVGVENEPGWASCQIAYQKPSNFRLIGTAAFAGRVVDCGCNDERFWFWNGFQSGDEIYYCRLDQYQGSAFARVLPIDPTWFPEAFGIVGIQDDEIVDGPTEQNDGSLLITSKKSRPDGVYLRRTYFDAKTAAILRQDVQNPNGETIVTVRCKESQYVETPGVVLPKRLEIFSPATNETLIVNLGTPTVNNLEKNVKNAFEQPTDLKATAIDLGERASAAAANSTNESAPVADANVASSTASPQTAAKPQVELPPVVKGTGLPIDASGQGVPIDAQPTTFVPPAPSNDALVAAAPTQPSNSFYSNQTAQTAVPNAAFQSNVSENSNYSAQSDSTARFTSPTNAANAPNFNANGDVPFPAESDVVSDPNAASSLPSSRVVQPTPDSIGAPYVAPPIESPLDASSNAFNASDSFNDFNDSNAPIAAANTGFGDYVVPETTPDAPLDPFEFGAPLLIDETRSAATSQPFVVDAPPATAAPVPIADDPVAPSDKTPR